ncbi:uncharacterized protein F5891DRAFT_1196976 [Suillus fuscotomentosus]|uniref:Uncharacterized protein n=1 Tax=Suillus fuscotomentosus TaxID=1912939 RepID=A0AAD4HDY4_9AGAM|nr:uncharacterized protein F5891DRAFT_1196976 [Suillus fuscotomentosus]KAG1893007.1 hypothetical protein F5891DRAFT_1196976 [Suillus fuscotomentosus]
MSSTTPQPDKTHTSRIITSTKTTIDATETETVKERTQTVDSTVTHTISGPSNLPILNTMIEMPDASAPSSPTELTVSTITSTLQSDPASPAQSSQSSEDLWVQLEDLSEYMNAVNLSEGEGM